MLPSGSGLSPYEVMTRVARTALAENAVGMGDVTRATPASATESIVTMAKCEESNKTADAPGRNPHARPTDVQRAVRSSSRNTVPADAGAASNPCGAAAGTLAT